MTVTTAPEPAPDAPPPSRGRRLRPLLLLLVLVVLGGGTYAATNVLAADDSAQDAHDHSTHDHAVDGHLPALNPCTFVTAAEVEAVVGAVTAPAEGGVGVVSDQRVCTMNLERDTRFMVTVGFTDFEAAGKYRGFAGRFPGVAEQLADLGDDAVYIETFRLALVRVGDELVTVQLSDVFAEPADVRDQAIRLARLAVDGLANAERA